ncbi:MAG TPA: ESX secretion-associated protein EspG [Actinophytocola sp.]|uniref:ESX secretion-associated protein EspG n=1 Tax=Actinophytocola sp. TaxID=1872138 RepID=UPI002DDD70DC|nr:ESX secretion-associated protein EspG [Actinophytocola sp.]HEV2780301.1 ESX secretion-associated protein EspG [Actinophytocola sp.]
MSAVAELSLPAVDVLWEDLGLGGVPFPLEVPGHGETVGERARIRAAVYGELELRGLGVDELEGVLGLLARPEIGVDLVGRLDPEGGEPVRAVAVARGRRGMRAVQRNRGVELSEVRDTAVVASIVELLPAQRPGPGRSITLPVAALEARRPVTHRVERQLVAAIMDRPVARVGQLGVMVRDDRGGVRRLPGIAWFDTDQGRYATTIRRGGDGADWTTLFPADNARLAHRLSDMIAAVRR